MINNICQGKKYSRYKKHGTNFMKNFLPTKVIRTQYLLMLTKHKALKELFNSTPSQSTFLPTKVIRTQYLLMLTKH